MVQARLHRWGRALLDSVLPPLCPGCAQELVGARWICAPCRRQFRRAPPLPLCFVCRGERSAKNREAGFGCTVPEHAPSLGWAVFWMEAPLDAVVHQLKYGGRPDLGVKLGELMGQMLPDFSASVIVPIPLHRTRKRERGYNQAERLARGLARRRGMTVDTHALWRHRGTRTQALLHGEERMDNVRSAFAVRGDSLPDHAVILDDVTTTGATLYEARCALIAARTVRVVPVALAVA